MTTTKTIASSAMLVTLNISVWPGKKMDRKASAKLAADAEASEDAWEARKNLDAGTYQRRNIEKLAARIRTWHNEQTIPWADKGERLLPTSLFFDYKQRLNEWEQEFNRERSKFLTHYPEERETMRLASGTMYDAADYPTVEEMATKFAFRSMFSPVPESGDFRVDVPAEALDDIRAQYGSAFNNRLAEAMKEPWARLHEMLTHMSDKLVEPEDDVSRRWHDSFVTRATEMCEMLSHLNVTGDPELERARAKLERAMQGADIEAIKESPEVREDIKADVDAILGEFDW